MTAWNDLGPADFNAALADHKAARRAQEAAEAGQAGLFFVPTPARAAKPAPVPEELPGQAGLFGNGDQAEDGPCLCGDCRPDPYPPEAMRPSRGHWECCGQAHRGPCCQQTGEETAQ